MKNFILLFVFLLFVSCQLFDSQAPEEEVLLKKELEKINWQEVDEYPSLSICDSVADKEEQKICFIQNVFENIKGRISLDTLNAQFPTIDTLHLKITINPNSSVRFESDIPTETADYSIQKLDSVLQTSLKDFPKIEPAIKKGIKVKTEFILPIAIPKKP